MYKFLRGNKPLFLLAKCPEVWLFGLYVQECMYAFSRGGWFPEDCIGLRAQQYVSSPVCPQPCQHLVLIMFFTLAILISIPDYLIVV